MHPYVHEILERNAREARARAAPQALHLHEVLATRTADGRIPRLTSVRPLLQILRGHVRVPASVGGRT